MPRQAFSHSTPRLFNPPAAIDDTPTVSIRPSFNPAIRVEIEGISEGIWDFWGQYTK